MLSSDEQARIMRLAGQLATARVRSSNQLASQAISPQMAKAYVNTAKEMLREYLKEAG